MSDLIRTDDQTALAMVRQGYSLDDEGGYADGSRCLMFRIGFDHYEVAAEACRLIGRYNEFDGERAAHAIYIIATTVATRFKYLRFWVGRENSPVIYVSGVTPDQTKAIMLALTQAGAEECHDQGYTVRAWWD